MWHRTLRLSCVWIPLTALSFFLFARRVNALHRKEERTRKCGSLTAFSTQFKTRMGDELKFTSPLPHLLNGQCSTNGNALHFRRRAPLPATPGTTWEKKVRVILELDPSPQCHQPEVAKSTPATKAPSPSSVTYLPVRQDRPRACAL